MGRIRSDFGFQSTAADVLKDVDLSGQRAIVTGGSGGIGLEICRALASAGADVTIAARDIATALPVAQALRRSGLPGHVTVQPLDLANLPSISRFVAEWQEPLDILINNAGIMMLPELRRTADGWEMQFATNFLGHYQLTLGLRPALAAAPAARIIALSSSGHLFSPILFDDPSFRFVPYDPLIAYGQSKTAAILFAVEATARWRDQGITVNAVMPGAVATNLQKHTGGLRTPPERRKSPQQGAATPVWAAIAPQLQGIGGRYFEDMNEAEVVFSRNEALTGVAHYAVNPANARRFWELCERLITDAASLR